jgi:molecular chaperone DnaK (HSP70)
LLNEPSAAGVEYGHSIGAGKKGSTSIVVYDLGAGTFDASRVEIGEQRHEVLASEGIPTLGGDNFDEILAELALEEAGIAAAHRESLSQAEWFRLQDECRQKKDALNPNTRRITVDLAQVREGWPAVTIPAPRFYEHCQPLIQDTIETVGRLMQGREETLDSLYVVGGGSELPTVLRFLRDRFGRRVRRSPYPLTSAAIGLAIQADEQAGYVLREKFTRNFGVWREAESGAVMVLDPLFLKGTPLPAPGDAPLFISRQYSPAHNIGRFRYLECSHTANDGRPGGDEAIWDEIVFPFDGTLQGQTDLGSVPVLRGDEESGCEIREEYRCDASGLVTVTIADLRTGYSREYRLGRWAPRQALVTPGRPLKSKAAPSSRRASS